MIRRDEGRRRAVAAILVVLWSAVTVFPARAEPLPADYDGSTHGDVLALNLTATGIDINAALGHSATTTDSMGGPRAHAESANLEAGAVGIPVSVLSGEANADNTTATDTYGVALGEVDVPGVLNTGALTGTGVANWAGDAACVVDGTPIAQSTISLAEADLGLTLDGVELAILDLGAVQTTGQTTLQAGSVVSTSSGNIASLALFNGLVDVDVVSNPTLTATSDGTTGTVTANDYAVAVTIAGTTTTVTAGGSIPIELDIGALSVNTTLSVGALVDSSSGATASGSMTFLSLTGTIGGLLRTLATLDLGILPLSATATSAPGGVECDVLDPPVITSPTAGEETGETPTIVGTGIPDATMTVSEGGVTLGTALVGADGTWSVVPTDPLAPGGHTIEATQELGGIASAPSAPVSFTVLDTTAPDPPVIVEPADGSFTNDSTPAISGTAEPGSTVVVTDQNGVELGTATADAGGNWSFQSIALADNTYTITATADDASGNTSDLSAPVTLTVDTAISPPVTTGPADGSTIGDSTPTITGTGEPGATVAITIDGVEVGDATVGVDGTWTFEVPNVLADGAHTVTATQTDAAGNESGGSAPLTFTVDTAAPDPPVITSPSDGDLINDSTPTITGTGEPGALVDAIVDGLAVGTAVVDPGGTWSLDLTDPLDDGQHTAAVTQTDQSGNVSEEAAITFIVDTRPPDPPEILTPRDGDGLADRTPTFSGTGEPGATVQIIDIEGSATVDGDGQWSFSPDQELACGAHSIAATQTDEAANTSDPSGAITLTIVCTVEDRVVDEVPLTGFPANLALLTATGASALLIGILVLAFGRRVFRHGAGRNTQTL